MRKLQVVQNKCMRMMTGLDRSTPTKTLLKHSNLLSVHQTVAHHSAVQVYNVLKHEAPVHHYQRLFPQLVHDVNRRSATNLTTSVDFSNALGRSSFFYQSSNIWNAIPASIKTAETLQTFKTGCKKWIMNTISIRPQKFFLSVIHLVKNSCANRLYLIEIQIQNIKYTYLGGGGGQKSILSEIPTKIF